MPPEGTRPTLKWGQAITELAHASRLVSLDHIIQETPAGTVLEHTPSVKAALRNRGSESELAMPFVNVFTQTGDAEGTWTPGKVYVGGVEYSVVALPTTIGPITESTLYWIRHAFSGGTTWESGPMAGGYPPMEENIEIYRMLELTFEEGAITKIVCPQPMDIHAPARSY